MRSVLRRGLSVVGSVVTLASLVVATAGSAAADEVTVKGTVLSGKVTGFSSSSVTLEPEYGKGEIAIDWEDVEDIRTEGVFHVLHSDDQATVGQLQGVSDGKVLVGASPEAATGVDLESVFLGVAIDEGGLTFADRMRSYWRYWDGHFDAGFNLQEATTDTLGFLFLFETTRTNYPTKLTLGAGYRYGTQKAKGEEESRIEDTAFGLIRGDYNFTPRVYGFASGDVTYDSIQELSIRGVPKAGVGYVLCERRIDDTTRDFLQAEVGGGWVYEKFFGGEDDSYFTIVFGALAEYHLPYGAVFGWKLDYLPAVDDFGNFLLRNDAFLTVPIVGPINGKLGLRDEYDSEPAEDVDKNSLYFIAGLSLVW
jgi:hypothetical protein